MQDAVSKENVFLSYADIPQLMEILGALDSKFICVPGPAIGNNLIFFAERSDLSEFGSERVDLLLFCEVEFKGIGEK